MNKRIMSILMAGCLMMSLTACGGKTPAQSKEETTTTVETTTEETTTTEATTTTEETTTEETTFDESTINEDDSEKVSQEVPDVPKGWKKFSKCWGKDGKLEHKLYMIQKGKNFRAWYYGRWCSVKRYKKGKVYIYDVNVGIDAYPLWTEYFRHK